jgi:hypothetical protein
MFLANEAMRPRPTITVISTSVQQTLAALKKAEALANDLNGRIALVVPQVVPYPRPLASLPAMQDWNESRFREFINQSSVETTVQVYPCRDPLEAVNAVLSPRSIVVLGGAKRFWPTLEERLARILRRSGHEVIFTGKIAGRHGRSLSVLSLIRHSLQSLSQSRTRLWKDSAGKVRLSSLVR